MGIFDIFKGKKDGSRAIAAEMDKQKKIYGKVIDFQMEFEDVKKAYAAAKAAIDKATEVDYVQRLGLFQKLQQDTITKLNEIRTRLNVYIEELKEKAFGHDAIITLFKLDKEITDNVNAVETATIANGPTGPAGPQ